MKRTILLVDDECDNLAPMRILLAEEYEVLTADGGAEALMLLEQRPGVDVVIADQRMPGMSGAELLGHIRVRYPEIVRIVLTGYADWEAIVSAVNNGQVYRYISKPWDYDDMRFTLRQALEWKDLRQERGHLSADLAVAHQDLLERTKQLELAQAALLKQEKLAAVGRIAAELAHEMNNQLQVLMSVNEVIRGLFEEHPEELELIQGLEDSTRVLADIAADIRDFARGAKLPIQILPVDPAALAEQIARTCRRLPVFRKREIAVTTATPDAWPLDERQIRHVLFNLLKNAAKASPQGAAIELQVHADRNDLVLTVADHGRGIPAIERGRIFEPFITGWQDGDGTGLGLAICRQIVDAHGGRITCDETPGGGATFRVQLPQL